MVFLFNFILSQIVLVLLGGSGFFAVFLVVEDERPFRHLTVFPHVILDVNVISVLNS